MYEVYFFKDFIVHQPLLGELPPASTICVQGVVTDSLTREPLPYTSVYLKYFCMLPYNHEM